MSQSQVIGAGSFQHTVIGSGIETDHESADLLVRLVGPGLDLKAGVARWPALTKERAAMSIPM